jgi:hypothetical protein
VAHGPQNIQNIRRQRGIKVLKHNNGLLVA